MNKSEKEFNMSFVKTYDVLTLSNLVANFKLYLAYLQTWKKHTPQHHLSQISILIF